MIDYGRLGGSRAGPIGWILALVAGLLLLPLAIAFAVRYCMQHPKPPKPMTLVLVGTTSGTQTEAGIVFRRQS